MKDKVFKILDAKSKPKTFDKQVKNADFVIVDMAQQNSSLDEARMVINALKTTEKETVLTINPVVLVVRHEILKYISK